MNIEYLSLWFAVFAASLIQGAAGFGLALVITPLLVQWMGVKGTTPLIGLLGSTIGIVFIFYYRQTLNWRTVLRLALPACFGIPAGILILSRIPEKILIIGLGIFLVLYALYALRTPQLPVPKSPRWVYLVGFLSGILTGAYAIGGPPIVVYASARRWEIATFKSNIQAYFLITGIFMLATFAMNGDLTTAVWRYYLLSLPVMVLGLAAGLYADRFLKGERFRYLVLYLILLLGARLLFV